MLIDNNLLCLHKTSEFNTRIINYFYNRLKMFLLLDYRVKNPIICFTTNKKIINTYFKEAANGNIVAFYDHTTFTIVVNANKYIYNKNHIYYKQDFIRNIPDNIINLKPKFIIPLQDIYHELIHHVQFCCNNYKYPDILEGTAELFAIMITGQLNMVYIRESIALWYIARKIFKMNIHEFYGFIANTILDPIYLIDLITSKKQINNIIQNKYKGNMKIFLNNIKKEFYNQKYYSIMVNDLNKIHNMVFYKY